MPLQSTTALATITIQSASSEVRFTSIPNTYRDLIVVCNWQNSGTGDAVRIQVNGGGGEAYFGVWMTGTGSTTASGNESFEIASRAGGANVGPANTFSNTMTVQFLDYSATDKHKTYLVRYGAAGTETQATVSRFSENSAINFIRLFNILGQTFQVGSTFSLYGRIA